MLAEDGYYHDLTQLSLAEREQVNFDHPAAFEHQLLLTHLRQLRAGTPVPVPEYDYLTHTRRPHRRSLPPGDLLIVEGILLLVHGPLRAEFDLRLFLDTPLEVCLARRLRRDCRSRGRSAAAVKRQFAATVLPMYRQHLLPTRQYADLLLSGMVTPQALGQQVQQALQHRGYLGKAGARRR